MHDLTCAVLRQAVGLLSAKRKAVIGEGVKLLLHERISPDLGIDFDAVMVNPRWCRSSVRMPRTNKLLNSLK